jgi:hypothetical protein
MWFKRWLLGRPLATKQVAHERVGKAVGLGLLAIAILTWANLRGVREAGRCHMRFRIRPTAFCGLTANRRDFARLCRKALRSRSRS